MCFVFAGCAKHFCICKMAKNHTNLILTWWSWWILGSHSTIIIAGLNDGKFFVPRGEWVLLGVFSVLRWFVAYTVTQSTDRSFMWTTALPAESWRASSLRGTLMASSSIASATSPRISATGPLMLETSSTSTLMGATGMSGLLATTGFTSYPRKQPKMIPLWCVQKKKFWQTLSRFHRIYEFAELKTVINRLRREQQEEEQQQQPLAQVNPPPPFSPPSQPASPVLHQQEAVPPASTSSSAATSAAASVPSAAASAALLGASDSAATPPTPPMDGEITQEDVDAALAELPLASSSAPKNVQVCFPCMYACVCVCIHVWFGVCIDDFRHRFRLLPHFLAYSTVHRCRGWLWKTRCVFCFEHENVFLCACL